MDPTPHAIFSIFTPSVEGGEFSFLSVPPLLEYPFSFSSDLCQLYLCLPCPELLLNVFVSLFTQFILSVFPLSPKISLSLLFFTLFQLAASHS